MDGRRTVTLEWDWNKNARRWKIPENRFSADTYLDKVVRECAIDWQMPQATMNGDV